MKKNTYGLFYVFLIISMLVTPIIVLAYWSDEPTGKTLQEEPSLSDLLDAETWRKFLDDLTNNMLDTFGPLMTLILLSIIYILLLVAQVILAPLPGVVFFVSAGVLYPKIFVALGMPAELGIIVGTIIGTTGSCLGALFAWGVSYVGGYPIARKFLGEDAMEESTKWLNRWGAFGIFLARMMPFAPSDPVSYIAGAGRMKLKSFLLPLIVGSLIATTLYTIMGYMIFRGLEGAGATTQLADTILFGIFLACFAVIIVVVIYKRAKFRQESVPEVGWSRVSGLGVVYREKTPYPNPDDEFLTPEEIEELEAEESKQSSTDEASSS
ncbi:MAG: TVP38/TMEM64 family protein [Promethearchaeota archaeon]